MAAWSPNNRRSARTTTHTQLLLHHLRAQDEVSNSLLITLSLSQLQAGIPQLILQSKWKAHGHYMTDTWITKSWEFLSTHNLQVKVPNAWTPLPQCMNDQFTMEIATQLLSSKGKIWQIQQCHTFLQVSTISNITEATGHYIDNFARTGQSRPQH